MSVSANLKSFCVFRKLKVSVIASGARFNCSSVNSNPNVLAPFFNALLTAPASKPLIKDCNFHVIGISLSSVSGSPTNLE